MKQFLFLLASLILVFADTKPPMGWSSFCFQEKWNLIDIEICDPSAAKAKDIYSAASYIFKNGFFTAGYNHIIIENNWPDAKRTEDNELQASQAFLAGYQDMATLISEIKKLDPNGNFKVGLATSATQTACYGGGAGSFGYYEQDIKTFLNWGVDYIKLEWCDGASIPPNSTIKDLFQDFGKKLHSASSSVFFAASEFLDDSPWSWAPGFADSWRVGPTHIPWFIHALDSSRDTYHIIENLAGKSNFAGPSKGWNDPDFILDQSYPYQFQTQLAIWAITNSPLIISNDIVNVPSGYKNLLLNKYITQINQDTTSVGDRIKNNNGQVWKKKLAEGFAVVLYNDNYLPFETETVTINFKDLDQTIEVADVIEIFSSKSYPRQNESFSMNLNPENSVVLIITPASSVSTTGGSTTGDSTTGDSTTGGSTTGDSTTGGSTTGDSTTGDSTTGHHTTGHATTGHTTTGHHTTGHATTGHNSSSTFSFSILVLIFSIFFTILS